MFVCVFKPDPAVTSVVPEQKNTPAVLPKVPRSIKSVEKPDIAVQQQYIQQREALYADLGQLSSQMIEGKKPDVRQVLQMMRVQNHLVKNSMIEKSEALTMLVFLQSVLPELHQELEQVKRELNDI